MAWIGTCSLVDVASPATLAIHEEVSGIAGMDSPFPGRVLVPSATGLVASDAGQVLTNEHVVDECAALAVGRNAWNGTEARVLATNRGADLAILEFDVREWARVAVFRSNLPLLPDEETAVLGFPGNVGQGPSLPPA